MKNFKAGIDKVYKSLVTESEVPEVTTDDFVMFLQWMAKRTNEDGEALYTPLNIADVVAEPHHYSKEFTEYQSWRESEFGNSILHPNENRERQSEASRGTIQIVNGRDGERKLLYTIDGSKEYEVGDIDFKDLRTGETVTSNTRIRAQLERALRFNPDFQEDGAPKYDVTSPATHASRDAGGDLTEVGQLAVSILWNKDEPQALEVGSTWEFKLTPKPVNAAFARQPAAVR